jgi:hypothetical protein
VNRPVIDPELEQITAENLDFLSALTVKDQVTNAELRAASGILRSLIVYDELSKVAQGRTHKLLVAVPDTTELIQRIDADREVLLFQLGGYSAFGVEVSTQMIERRSRASALPFEPGKMVEVKLSAFKSQTVFVVRMVTHPAKGYAPAVVKKGLISRDEVIAFAANKLGGRHYDQNRDEDHHVLLEAIRRASMTDVHEDNVRMSLDHLVFEDPAYRASKRPPGIGSGKHHELDPVLLETLGAAALLVTSPSVMELRGFLGT